VDISSYISIDVLGTTYYPPADGYIVFTGTPTAAANNNTIDLQARCRVIIPCTDIGTAAVASAPVSKGEPVHLVAHGVITYSAIFVYTNGEVPTP
jgi:hypothetical protein